MPNPLAKMRESNSYISYMVEWVRPVAYIDMSLSSISSFSRAGRHYTNEVVNRTDLAPIPSLSIP